MLSLTFTEHKGDFMERGERLSMDRKVVSLSEYRRGRFARVVAVHGLPAQLVVGPPPAPFTCPKCRRTSADPWDTAFRYCGACNVFLDPPVPV